MRSLRYASLAGLIGIAVACEDDPVQQGEIIVVVQTDVSLPESIDKMKLEVIAFGTTQFANEFDIGPAPRLRIPATLGVLQGKDPATPILVRLTARKEGKAKMLREVVTTIPTARIARLDVPIRWFCDDSAEEKTPPNVTNAKCPNGQTCIGGDCYGNPVDGNELPNFDPSDVFDKGCFDIGKCMSGYTEVAMDLPTCTFPAPADTVNLNVGVRVQNDGYCDTGKATCLVMLDPSPNPKLPFDGWRVNGPKIELAKAVCERIDTKRVLGVFASSACPAKAVTTPLCGTPFQPIGPTPLDAGSDGGPGNPSPPQEVADNSGLIANGAVQSQFAFAGGFEPRVHKNHLFYTFGSSVDFSRHLYALNLANLNPITERKEIGSAIAPDTIWFANAPEPEAAYYVSLSQFYRVDLGATSTNATPIGSPFASPTGCGSVRCEGIDSLRVYAAGGANLVESIDRLNASKVGHAQSSVPNVAWVTADTDPAGFIYIAGWASQGGKASIYRVPKTQTTGGATLVTEYEDRILDLLIDGPTVYGTNILQSANPATTIRNIFRVPAGGGTASTIYENQNGARSLRLLQGMLYWIGGDVGDGGTGHAARKIFRGPPTGGVTPELLATSTDEIIALAVAPKTATTPTRLFYFTRENNGTNGKNKLFYINLN